MKIAFIVGEFPVLSETFILNQVTGLLDRGHDVDIYADRYGDQKMHDVIANYKLLDRTYYFHEVPDNLTVRALKGVALFIANVIRDPIATMRSLNVTRYKNQALSLWLLYTVIPNFNKTYDVIHCQFGTVSFRGMAFQAMNAPGAKLITIFRGQDISRFVDRKGDDVYAPLFKQGDYFLANCHFFKQRAIQLGCPPDKIRVHGSGLDLTQFPFRFRQLPEAGPLRVVTVGRLVEKKGIEYGIRAVAKVLKTGSNLEYLIIGDGPLRESLAQLIQTLGIDDVVKLEGRKSHGEIVDLLDKSHLFMAPCVTAADGDQDAPVNVLKEAMAMGLPVISTLHGGIPELVEEDVSGFLVPERDADAIVDRLLYLIQHSERWPAMGHAGRAVVEQNYNLNTLNDSLVDLYESLLSSDVKDPSPASLSLSC